MQVQTDVRSDKIDTLKYAQISGDWNPAHTDAPYAKREGTLPDGQSIVHGAHIMGWFSARLNEIGEKVDAEVILVDMFTEFHNPLEVEQEARVIAEIVDDDNLPTEENPKVIVDVGLRCIDHDTGLEYTTGSATIMLDATVQR